MTEQLHKRKDDNFVRFILKQYLSKQLSLDKALENLKIKKTRFFEILNEYKKNPENFSISYMRGKIAEGSSLNWKKLFWKN